MSVLKWILSRAKEMEDSIIEWRRDFHMYPELGFQEKRTAGIVADRLR
ncbi:MAG: amidohydrolase, partial [Candidatus Methanomethylicota archaeon]